MLYRIFKTLFIPAINGYFRSVYINNVDKIPSKGPVILAVNHNSAFMDPILIATTTKRNYHFLARGEAFNSAFSRFFYDKLNMLPVYRPETTPDDVHKNKYVFKKCFEHLTNKKAIMIFPEGFSKTERRIREIKSGLARIALGAESQNNFELDIKIIPVGINYTNPHLFQSDVLINIGDVISASDFKELFYSNEKASYDHLTEAVRTGLESCTAIISDERQVEFVESLEWFLKNQIHSKESKSHNLVKSFMLSKELVTGVETLAVSNPKKFTEIELHLLNYRKRFERLSLDQDKIFRKKGPLILLLNLMLLVLTSPVFLYGMISNLLPFSLTKFISGKIKVREDFLGSLKLTAGMFLFLIVYLIQGFILNVYFGKVAGLVLFSFFYPSGLISLFYLRIFLNFIKSLRHNFIFRKKKQFFYLINEEQINLEAQINKYILNKSII